MTSINAHAQAQISDRFNVAFKALNPDSTATLTNERGWWTITETDKDGNATPRKMRESALLEHVAAMEDLMFTPTTVASIAKKAGVTTTANDSQPFGFLTWWTVEQGNRDIDDLREQADAAKVPSWIVDSLSGAKPETAWLRATQLGSKGVASASDGNSMARFLVRDAGDRIRILIREIVDENNVAVSLDQMGVLTMKGDGIEFEASAANSVYTAHEKEVNAVITAMRDDLYDRIGKIDDNRIRSLILRWLSRRFRVCVRGTGGVYFIPVPRDPSDAQDLMSEIQSLRLWMSSSHLGTFSIVALQPGGATTIEDFQESAIEDLKGEIEEVQSNIARYASQANMNAGSQMFSANTQVERLDQIREKMETLTEALGSKVGTVQGMLDIVRQRAFDMVKTSSGQVTTAREAKNKERDARINARKEESAKLKAGTAKERNGKKKV